MMVILYLNLKYQYLKPLSHHGWILLIKPITIILEYIRIEGLAFKYKKHENTRYGKHICGKEIQKRDFE